MVGRGDEQPDIVRQLLDVEAVPRKPQYLMAPEASANHNSTTPCFAGAWLSGRTFRHSAQAVCIDRVRCVHCCLLLASLRTEKTCAIAGATAAGSVRVPPEHRMAQVAWHAGSATGPAAHNAASPDRQDQVRRSVLLSWQCQWLAQRHPTMPTLQQSCYYSPDTLRPDVLPLLTLQLAGDDRGAHQCTCKGRNGWDRSSERCFGHQESATYTAAAAGQRAIDAGAPAKAWQDNAGAIVSLLYIQSWMVWFLGG